MSKDGKIVRTIILHIIMMALVAYVFAVSERSGIQTAIYGVTQALLLLSISSTISDEDKKSSATVDNIYKDELAKLALGRLEQAINSLDVKQKRKRKNDMPDYAEPDYTVLTGDDPPLLTFNFRDELEQLRMREEDELRDIKDDLDRFKNELYEDMRRLR